MRERIYLTPYIPGAIEKPINSVDGLTFGCEEPCLFLANKPVPKESNCAGAHTVYGFETAILFFCQKLR